MQEILRFDKFEIADFKHCISFFKVSAKEYPHKASSVQYLRLFLFYVKL